MQLNGACECEAVTYRIVGSPVYVYTCHCLNCQTRSGSAFAEHAMVPVSAFHREGETVGYKRNANGIEFEEAFCAKCYTRILNHNNMLPDMIFLRAGTLATSHSLDPIAHIWTDRKQSWVRLPDGVPAFPKSPTPEEFGLVIQATKLLE